MSNNTNKAVTILDQVDGSANDARRVITAAQGNVDDAINILGRTRNTDRAVRVLDAADGNGRSASRFLASANDDFDAAMSTLAKTGNNMDEATTILNKVGGSSHEAARVIDAANGNSTKAIQVLDSAGDSVDKTVTILKKVDGNADDALRVLNAAKNNADDAITILSKTNNNASRAATILEKVDGDAIKAARVIDAAKGKSGQAIEVLDKVGNNPSKAVEILNQAGGDGRDAVRVLDAAQNDFDGAMSILRKTRNADEAFEFLSKVNDDAKSAARLIEAANNNVEDALYVLDQADGDVNRAIRAFEEIGGNIDDTQIKSKYKLCVDDPNVMAFYRRAEYRISLGQNPSKVMVSELFDSTKTQFKMNNSLLTKDIKDLQLDDFLEFAKNEVGISSGSAAAKSAHTTRAKLVLTKTMRLAAVGANVAMTAVQIYSTVKFIEGLADALEDGTMEPHEVGEEASAYITSSACGWLTSELAATFFGAALPLVGVTGPLGVIAVVVFAVGAGITGSQFGDWIARELYQPSYDTVWGILDYFGSDNIQTHLLEGTSDGDIMDFSTGRIKLGLMDYAINYKLNVTAGNGDDEVTGYIYNDELYGQGGNDTIHGGEGNDTIDGGDENDTLYGDNGDDYIDGGNGVDMIYGGDGEDKIYGGADDDILYGGNHTDMIYGNAGTDRIYGEGGDDFLYGNAGDDLIEGGDGDDTIYGDDKNYAYNNGNDFISGGAGDDRLYGEEGDDKYIFAYGYEHDTIFDKLGKNRVHFDDIVIDSLILEYETVGKEKNLNIKVKDSKDVITIRRFDETKDHFTFSFVDCDDRYKISDEDDLHFEKFPPEHSGGSSSGSRLIDIMRHDQMSHSSGDYNRAGNAQPPRDPLIIDANREGKIETIGLDKEVFFDLDANGFAENTAWAGKNEGFLALDLDGSGFIENGRELFGDETYKADGIKATSGFDALSQYDENGDKIIDENDTIYDRLLLWIDSNSNGFSDKGELISIKDADIKSISVEFDEIMGESDPETGVKVTHKSSVSFNEGDPVEISEHWFDVSTVESKDLHDFGDGSSMTGVDSFGSIMTLNNAIMADTTGELMTMVETFKHSSDFIEKRILIKKILYFLGDVNEIAPDSRGGNIDARDLAVIERFMDVDFVGVNGSNPNSTAASILRNVFDELEALYYNLLDSETMSGSYFELLNLYKDANEKNILDYSIATEELTTGEADEEVAVELAMFIKCFDSIYGTRYLNAFVSDLLAIKPEYKESLDNVYVNIILGNDDSTTLNGTNNPDIIFAEAGNDTVNAGNGNDKIYGGDGNDRLNAGSGNDVAYGGAGNDELYGDVGDDTLNGDDILYGSEGNDALDGGEGNDALYGENGNDTLSGGTGDDILDGGAGDDTYYINAEHGNDTIIDSEGLTTIVFGDEISADSYELNIDINSGITLVNSETGETIGLPDFINVPENYEFTFDGESKILGGGETRQVIEGTDGDDTITAGDGFNIIRGGEGNDTITGGENLNFIYGGDGDDTITGGNGINIIRGEGGDDTITDGTGDGYLDGGDGNDTIHAGAGNDILIGGAGNDQLFGEDGDDVIAGNDGDDYLSGGDGNDTLYADAGNDELHGDNGDDSLFGGDGDDTLYGDAGDDYLEAGNGTDTLYGGTGNDIFVGGEGINYMYGEDGDDTFYGGNALNYMYGGNGDDNFTGGEHADYIEGGAGNDTMNGGNGSNEMYGGEGDDYIYGGNDDDYIEGGSGDDHLYGGNGVNTIYGGAGNDTIFDGDNNGYLYGGDGDDEIRAGGGSDVLDGGAGNDYLQSDHGGDTYVFGIGYDIDTINASADLNIIQIHG